MLHASQLCPAGISCEMMPLEQVLTSQLLHAIINTSNVCQHARYSLRALSLPSHNVRIKSMRAAGKKYLQLEHYAAELVHMTQSSINLSIEVLSVSLILQ